MTVGGGGTAQWLVYQTWKRLITCYDGWWGGMAQWLVYQTWKRLITCYDGNVSWSRKQW